MRKRFKSIFPLALCLMIVPPGPTLSRADDDLLDDVRTHATTLTTRPASTEPDDITSKPSAPANARRGTITLNNNTSFKGQIWTTPATPLRVWVDAEKTYRDIDFDSIKKIDVIVDAQTMEDDWRWLKEGSDKKILSGKKYPNVELRYHLTLLNDKSIEGGVVAPIYIDDGRKPRALALYKKYKGQLDQSLADVAYIKTIELQPGSAAAVGSGKTRKLPLIDE